MPPLVVIRVSALYFRAGSSRAIERTIDGDSRDRLAENPFDLILQGTDVKSFFSLTLSAAFCVIGLTGCGGGGDTVVNEPETAVETQELTPEEQAEYDAEMAREMGN